MKTCLFTGSYLDGVDKLGNSRLERNIRYVNYYWPLRHEFGFDRIVLADNASDPAALDAFQMACPAPSRVFPAQVALRDATLAPITIFRFPEALPSGQTFPPGDPRSEFDYPYCWRALDFLHELFFWLDYDKVIAIDSDGFVLSPALARWIRESTEGWAALWCPRHSFPESSLQVVHRKAFTQLWGRDWRAQVGLKMETHLPFTRVVMGFNADRYGEAMTEPNDLIQYYGQSPLTLPMHYRWEECR